MGASRPSISLSNWHLIQRPAGSKEEVRQENRNKNTECPKWAYSGEYETYDTYGYVSINTFEKKIILWHKVFPGLCVLPCSVNTFSYSSSFPAISVSLGSWTLLWAHPISTCVLGMPAKSHSMPCTVSPNSAQVHQQIQLAKWEEYGNHLFRFLASLFHFYMYHQLHGE